VVLNAAESLSGSFADSHGDSAGLACPTVGDSQHCGSGFHDAGVRLEILGSTPTIPPIWLGGDSENRYSLAGNPFFQPEFDAPSPLELVFQLTVIRSNGQTEPQDQNLSQTNGAGTSSTNSSLGVEPTALEFTVPSPHRPDIMNTDLLIDVVGQDVLNLISEISSINATLAADPSIGYPVGSDPTPTAPSLSPGPIASCCTALDPGSGVASPEPSSWALMALGFAGLASLGYRARNASIAA